MAIPKVYLTYFCIKLVHFKWALPQSLSVKSSHDRNDCVFESLFGNSRLLSGLTFDGLLFHIQIKQNVICICKRIKGGIPIAQWLTYWTATL